jgi:hypothetical protein
MSNASLLVRSAVIYAICLPLAIGLGYLLATPDDLYSIIPVMLVMALLMVPILLHWHYPWLVAAWNMNAMVFLIPGRPSIAFVMCGISLGISLLQHTLNKNYKFIHVPTITWPLCFLTAIILITSRLTGGIGLAVAGSSSYGGKKYMWVFGAILGYFAFAARRIPPRKVVLYVSLFFLSALTSAITNMAGTLAPSIPYLYLVFPIDSSGMEALNPESVIGTENMISRLGGLSIAASSVFSFMLAIYGVRGLFDLRRPWRLAVFLLATVAALFGGFRSVLITFILTFALVFFLEGLAKSRFTPIIVLTCILAAASVLPFADRLPLSVQRTISFLPMVKIDPIAENAANNSTEWRLELWKSVLPQVPKYFFIGKGYSIDPEALAMAQDNLSRDASTGEGSAISGDYHNGPLSVILTFGIFGVIGFLWFLGAGIKVLHHNHLYGDPAWHNINTFLLASFAAKAVFFMTVFGSFYSDLATFTGILGMSIAINGGMRQPAMAAQRAVGKLKPVRPGAYAGAVR